MSIFRKWQRRKQRDKEALAKALREEPPVGAADFPFRVEFGWGGQAGQLVGLVLAVVGPLILHLILDFGLTFAIFIEIAFILLALASNIPDFTSLNRAVTISGEGVRLDKLHRSYVLPWWDVISIQSTPDLTLTRVIGRNARITLVAEAVPPEVRTGIIQALRARGKDYDLEVEEWPHRSRIVRGVVSGTLSLAAVAIFLAGGYLFFPGGTLGMRCSVNSAFLQETFDTPNRQGCVVLRVSAGAAKAGIQRGDLVIQMEGIPVTSGQQFQRIFDASHSPWEFVVIRKGESQPLHFRVEGGRGKNFREDSNDPFFYYLRARWDAGNKPEHAIQDYSRAIELEPRFDLAYLYRGQLYEERGDREAARRDYLAALEDTPDLGEAHAYYAYFLDVEDPTTARQHIEKAVELDACEGAFEGFNIDCSANYLLLASLLNHDPQRMAQVAEQGIRFYDRFADNYFNAMCAYSMLADDTRAQQYAREYLDFPSADREPDRTERAKMVLNSAGTC